MSDKRRNSDFKRKSGSSAGSGGDGKPASKRRSAPSPKEPPRRAFGSRTPGHISKPQSPKNRTHTSRNAKSGQSGPRSGSKAGGAHWIWGWHAAGAALNNPRRTIHEVVISEAAMARLDVPAKAPKPHIMPAAQLDRLLPRGAVHQGLAVKVAPLEWPDISDIAATSDPQALIVVLDQITDPHNVGAMLRLCSAFGACALIMQDRKAPPLGGACAKVAVGCVETIPVCLVTNIATTLGRLKDDGFMVTGLAGETDMTLATAFAGGGKQAIVMGAEGPGLRARVRKTCDQLAKIPMMSDNKNGQAESLNVATAAGIALYEARRG